MAVSSRNPNQGSSRQHVIWIDSQVHLPVHPPILIPVVRPTTRTGEPPFSDLPSTPPYAIVVPPSSTPIPILGCGPHSNTSTRPLQLPQEILARKASSSGTMGSSKEPNSNSCQNSVEFTWRTNYPKPLIHTFRTMFSASHRRHN